MALSTPPVAPQRGDRATFASRVDAFITWLIGFVSELNIFSANLNSLAAGGAYAIPFRFTTDTGHITQGSWLCLLNPTSITFDALDARYADTTAQLSNLLSGSTSAVKAQLRICAQADPSRWFLYNVIGYTQYGAYGGATVQIVASSGTFAEGESVIAFFQRTGDKGDKGDKGDSAVTQIMRVSDARAAGVNGDTAVATTWSTRTLNTVSTNTITGASLSANQISLPAGMYRFAGSANASAVGTHQAHLFNVTDAAIIDYGTTEVNGTGSGVSNRSVLRGTFTLAAPKVISLRHWASAAGSFGTAAATGLTQVYAELQIEKVA